jgi:hypothetical protein
MVYKLIRIASALILGLAAVAGGTSQAAAAQQTAAPVNLGHLDFLHDTIPYTTAVAGHGTTDPGQPIDTWWVYASYNSTTGTYARVGGGAYNAATNTYGQGAFDTDDVARAAVVYLAHYRAYGDQHSLLYARDALRFVLYMQTTTGPNAGNFILWMQPDGTLNPTPTPPDSPNPSDTGSSDWLVRSMWALGDGYATFRTSDPSFAAVLAQRMNLAMNKLNVELVAPNYGQYSLLHGYQAPKWLVGDGTDASSEAVLGLTSYYQATGSPLARQLIQELSPAIAGYQFGTERDWPWQALMPWVGSVSDWHAWAAHMSMALAVSGRLLGQPAWIAAAERDANQFEVHQQLSFGPINGLLPAPDDQSQIAYGVEATADGLLYLGLATHNDAYRKLAGFAASWFFGNNPAGIAMYQPDTGVVYDGINSDGTVNRNSGAESTIEGLYALINVVNDPVADAYVGYDHVIATAAYQKFEAEAGTLSGGATLVTPASAWTGEAQWSGGSYIDMTIGGSVTVPVTTTVAGSYSAYIVFDKQIAPVRTVGVNVSVDGVVAGSDDQGGAGSQGSSPNPDFLWIDSVALPHVLAAGPHSITLAYTGNGALHAKIDAILLQPAVEDKVLSDGAGGALAVYKSLTGDVAAGAPPVVAGINQWIAYVYTRTGQLVATNPISQERSGGVAVLPYGYTIVVGRGR